MGIRAVSQNCPRRGRHPGPREPLKPGRSATDTPLGHPHRRSGGSVREAEWERYRALVERSADVIVVLDGQGTVQYVNGTAATRFGQRPEELVGSNAFELVHPDDRSRAVESLHRALAAGPGPQDPFFARVRLPDGSWLPAELVGNNLT